jgi:hypothetical protein
VRHRRERCRQRDHADDKNNPVQRCPHPRKLPASAGMAVAALVPRATSASMRAAAPAGPGAAASFCPRFAWR